MRCEERREQLLLHAAGTLEDAETRALVSHLASGCPRCAGALAEAEAIVGQIPLALDPVAPSPAVRERLMERIAADKPRRSPSVVEKSFRERWLRPAIPAAAAAAITFLMMSLVFDMRQSQVEMELNRQENRIAQLESAVAETAVLEELVARQGKEIERLRQGADLARRMARLLRSPGTEIVELASNVAGLDASARLMWDRDEGVGQFFASGMRPAGQAKTYQLWFITTDDQKISAGTFDADAAGQAEFQLLVPPGIGSIAAAAVTDEPAGGSPQPTGSIQLVGAVPSA